jgi:hypothetical protein
MENIQEKRGEESTEDELILCFHVRKAWLMLKPKVAEASLDRTWEKDMETSHKQTRKYIDQSDMVSSAYVNIDSSCW